MRTTYGSPLFADHVPTHDSLLVERLRAGRRRDHRQDEHAGVRRRLADVQRGLRRHAQPVRPHQDARRVERRRRGGGRRRHDPVRRRLRPRRERPQPGRVLRPLRACAPRPAGFPTTAPATRGTRSRCSARSPARPQDVALLFSRARRPGPARSALDPGAVAAPADARRLRPAAACGSPGARPRRPAGRARGHRRARAARARRSRRSAASSRTPSPTSAAPTSASRCCAASNFAAAFDDDRRRRQAHAAREHPLRPAPRRGPDRQGARPARRAVHAHARVPHPLRLPRRPGHPGRAVQRRHRVPDRDRRAADGLLPRVVPLLQPDHGHRAPRALRARGPHARRPADRPAARRPPPRRARSAPARARRSR